MEFVARALVDSIRTVRISFSDSLLHLKAGGGICCFTSFLSCQLCFSKAVTGFVTFLKTHFLSKIRAVPWSFVDLSYFQIRYKRNLLELPGTFPLQVKQVLLKSPLYLSYSSSLLSGIFHETPRFFIAVEAGEVLPNYLCNKEPEDLKVAGLLSSHRCWRPMDHFGSASSEFSLGLGFLGVGLPSSQSLFHFLQL